MGPMTAQADGNNGPSKKGAEAIPVLGGARAEFRISRPTARMYVCQNVQGSTVECQCVGIKRDARQRHRAHGSERIRNEVLKYLILNQLKFWKKIEFELDSCNRDELEVASCGCSILSTSNVNWDAQ